MKTPIYICVVIFFSISQLAAQTARQKRDSSINDTRAKHLVERFEKPLIQPNANVQEKIRKSKARKTAILWHIDNSGLKENKKSKLRKALEKQVKSSMLMEFIAQHEEDIKEYVQETTSS